MGVMRDIPFGEKFGKLTILREVDSGKHANGKMKRMVEVVCDCGNVTRKGLTAVIVGQTKSCGTCKKDMPIKDVSGKKIGFLTVTDNFVRVEEGGANWKCVCECGNERWVHSSVLSRRGKTIHCGECRTPKGSHKFGDWYSNSRGQKFKLLDTHDLNDVIHCTMEDSEGRRFTIQYTNLTNGSFLSPWERSVAGVGYFGVGRFIAKGYREDRHTKEYEDLNSMLKRCYVGVSSETSYKDVEVCKDWHNFQNFAEWFYSQKHCEDGFAVDKDLKVIGSRLYSPETCSLVPCEVNSLFTGSNENLKERNLPKGVHFCKDKTLYIAQIHKGELTKTGNKKQTYLGQFNSKVEALSAYKVAKEDHVKEVANRFKNVLDLQVYNNLMEFEVDVSQWIKE